MYKSSKYSGWMIEFWCSTSYAIHASCVCSRIMFSVESALKALTQLVIQHIYHLQKKETTLHRVCLSNTKKCSISHCTKCTLSTWMAYTQVPAVETAAAAAEAVLSRGVTHFLNNLKRNLTLSKYANTK